MSSDPLGRVRRATARRSRAEAEWRATIKEAVASGQSLRSVGVAAGVTHARVIQINRE